MSQIREVQMSELVRPSGEKVQVDFDSEYNLLGVRLEGHGSFIRETKRGNEISAKALTRVKGGDFIYSRLFAWRGAFAVIPPRQDDCFVSNEFPTFSIDHKLVEPKYLESYFKQRIVWEEVERYCTGTTKASRNRLKEKFLLMMKVPLLPLTKQRSIIERLDKLDEVKSLHDYVGSHISNLEQAMLAHAFRGDLV